MNLVFINGLINAMKHRTFLHALSASVAALSLGACLVACGSQEQPQQATSSEYLATTQVWADVATEVVGEKVPAIIANSSTDPHDYEPTAADLARVAEAIMLVANGGTYDARLYAGAQPEKVVSALPLAQGDSHDHSHDHSHGADHAHEHDHAHAENEHIWYSTHAIADVGGQIAEKTGKDTTRLEQLLNGLDGKLAALPQLRVAQVHPIADAIISESALLAATPEQYRHATLNHSEPSPAAVAEFLERIAAGEIDVLIDNPQSPNSVSAELVSAAKEHNVPVVAIYETPPAGQNFFDYYGTVLDQLAQLP